MKNRALCLLLSLLLMAGVLPAGILSVSAAEEDTAVTGAYNSEDSAYVAYSTIDVRDFIREKRDDGKTVYMKLGRDMSYELTSSTWMVTNGADVVIDLCGHTFTCNQTYKFLSDENVASAYITGKNGAIILKDSKRYDEDKKQWVSGKLEYKYTGRTLKSGYAAVLAGDVEIRGATVVNSMHSSDKNVTHCAYYGNGLKMYSGTLEADTPVLLTNGDKQFGIYGGTLRQKRNGEAAIHVALDNEFYFEGQNGLPTFRSFKIINASGDSKAIAFDLELPYGFASQYNSTKAFEVFSDCFDAESKVYIDGVKQDGPLNGTLYNGEHVFGIIYSSQYELKFQTTICQLDVSIPEPQAGDHPNFMATVPDGLGYAVENHFTGQYWRNGVWWRVHQGKNLTAADTFERGEYYTVRISLVITDTDQYQFSASNTIAATVNGKAATIYRYSDTNYGVDYTFYIPTLIKEVRLTIDPPRIGQPLSYTASVPDDAGYRIFMLNSNRYRNGIGWETNGDVVIEPYYDTIAEAGKYYRVSFYITLTDPSTRIFAEDCKAYVNDVSVGFVVQADSWGAYSLSKDFTTPKNLISTLSVTIPEPKAGDTLSYNASIPSGMGYAIEDFDRDAWKDGVMWMDSSGKGLPVGSKFEVGKKYTVVVSLINTDKNNYQFADVASISAYINGKDADVYRYNDTNYGVRYTFTIPGGAQSSYILGDADTDGEVTIIDATAIQRKLAGLTPKKYDEKAADADEDGEVMIIDATAIQRYLAGLPAHAGIGQPVV